MLAYRHGFHAGNHADVLKHVVLAQVLRYMNRKDKPYRLVDTHAGAGGYALTGPQAQKKGEFEQGIARLWARTDLPPAVAEYVDLVREFNAGGPLEQYPGSPAIARLLLRRQDQLRVFELHPTDHRILASWLGKERGVEVYRRDGFEGLKGQLPPSSRRGVVLMDPSYELNADYAKVLVALRDALARFAEGVYVVWYPQVTKVEAARLPQRLQAAATAAGRPWLHVRMTVQQPDAQGFGLAGSGLVVVNPPYLLHDTLLGVMPWLVEVLGQYDEAHYLIEQQAA